MRESNYKIAENGNFYDFSPAITGGSDRADSAIFLGEPAARQFKDNDRLRENLQTTFQTTIGSDMVLTVDNTLSILDISTQGQMFGSWFGGWNTTDAVVAAAARTTAAVAPLPKAYLSKSAHGEWLRLMTAGPHGTCRCR